MKYLSFASSACLIIVGAFFVGNANLALAFPIQQFGGATDNGIVKVLCKYGKGRCSPGPVHPPVAKPPGAKWPSSGWTDPDCKLFGNCNPGSGASSGGTIARKGSSGTQPGHFGPAQPVGTAPSHIK